METVSKALNQVLPMNTTFNPSYAAIHNEMFVEQMQGRGMTLWPWTYNNRSAFDWAIDHGINGLTTNYANWAMDYVLSLIHIYRDIYRSQNRAGGEKDAQ